ncbi:MAG: hypothetical protein LQ337_002094 [Flavoplaca oasis]|nr:MAG: hypothetical protein LQ337_002094 [Flavoplaca oasis]
MASCDVICALILLSLAEFENNSEAGRAPLARGSEGQDGPNTKSVGALPGGPVPRLFAVSEDYDAGDGLVGSYGINKLISHSSPRPTTNSSEKRFERWLITTREQDGWMWCWIKEKSGFGMSTGKLRVTTSAHTSDFMI